MQRDISGRYAICTSAIFRTYSDRHIIVSMLSTYAEKVLTIQVSHKAIPLKVEGAQKMAKTKVHVEQSANKTREIHQQKRVVSIKSKKEKEEPPKGEPHPDEQAKVDAVNGTQKTEETIRLAEEYTKRYKK